MVPPTVRQEALDVATGEPPQVGRITVPDRLVTKRSPLDQVTKQQHEPGVRNGHVQVGARACDGKQALDDLSRIEEMLEDVVAADRVKGSLKLADRLLDRPGDDRIEHRAGLGRGVRIELYPNEFLGTRLPERASHDSGAAAHIEHTTKWLGKSRDEVRAGVVEIVRWLSSKRQHVGGHWPTIPSWECFVAAATSGRRGGQARVSAAPYRCSYSL